MTIKERILLNEKLTVVFAIAFTLIMIPYLITNFLSGRAKEPGERLEKIDSQKDVLININGENQLIDVEVYISKVIPGIADLGSSDQVLRAQVAAVRTNIYYKMGEESVIRQEELEYKYLTKGECEKIWGKSNYNKNMSRVEDAVLQTLGEILKE